MEPEDSIFFKAIEERLNSRISQGEQQPDFLEVENEVVDDMSMITTSSLEEIAARVDQIVVNRRGALRRAQEKTRRRHGTAINLLDRCLAYSEYVNSELIDCIFGEGSQVLRTKGFKDHPTKLTGAYLKCLLIVSLHARSCMLGTEASYLLRNGFPDGASSRVRSLHEHVVTLVLLMNDHTYEIAERYQDHAAYEDLKRMRALKTNLSDPIWSSSAEVREALDIDITEVEELVREGRDRWGSQLTEQYGWARPAFPATKKRIVFPDLEQLAGMEMFRSDYLQENLSVHAGPFATINHYKLGDVSGTSTRPHVDDDQLVFVGSRISMMIGWATRTAARAVASETEEYDSFLLYFPLKPLTEAAATEFFSHLRS